MGKLRSKAKLTLMARRISLCAFVAEGGLMKLLFLFLFSFGGYVSASPCSQILSENEKSTYSLKPLTEIFKTANSIAKNETARPMFRRVEFSFSDLENANAIAVLKIIYAPALTAEDVTKGDTDPDEIIVQYDFALDSYSTTLSPQFLPYMSTQSAELTLLESVIPLNQILQTAQSAVGRFKLLSIGLVPTPFHVNEQSLNYILTVHLDRETQIFIDAISGQIDQ
jgi:hypothetical protein